MLHISLGHDRFRLPSTHRILLQFLIPYVLLLTTAMLVGFFVNRNTIQLLEKEVVENNFAMLEQGRRNLDYRLSEISSITQVISGSSAVRDFQGVKEPFLGENVIQVLHTRDSMTDFALTNSFILDVFILYNEGNVVLAPRFTYRMQDFHEVVFHYEHMAYDVWQEFLFGKYHYNTYLPAQPAMYRYGDRPIVACVQSLSTSINSKGVVLVLIDNREIQSMLAGLDVTKNGWAYIADEEGSLISSVVSNPDHPIPTDLDLPSSERFIRRDDMLITYTTSEYNQWRYVVAQPYASIIQRVTHLGRTLLILFLSFLLLGVVLAALLAYWNSRPLTGIVRGILGRSGRQEDAGNAYSLIQSTLSSLRVTNDSLQQRMNEQRPLLRDSFFRRLFSGEIQTRNELETYMRHIGLEIGGSAFGVVILHVKGYQDTLSGSILQELAMKRILIRECLRDRIRTVQVHDIDQDDIALLVSCDDSQRLVWEKAVRQILQLLEEQLLQDRHVNLSFYVGDVYGSLLDVALSYREARSLQLVSLPEGWNQVLWYWDFPKDLNAYYYPEEIELRLATQVRAGMKEEAQSMMEILWQENMVVRHLSNATRTIFLYELIGTLTKLLEKLPHGDRGLKGEITAIAARLMDGHETHEKLFDEIRTLYLRICGGIEERKKSHNNQLIEDVLAFLDEHYADAGLGLGMVARHFHLSEVYLSQFFKEQAGENFSTKLEMIRMKKALHFLETTSSSIKEIADLVGYNSSNTFCRAFKRVHSVSATQYREQPYKE